MKISGNSPSQLAAEARRSQISRDASAANPPVNDGTFPSGPSNTTAAEREREFNQMRGNGSFNSAGRSNPDGPLPQDVVGDGQFVEGSNYGERITVDGINNYVSALDGNDVIEATGGGDSAGGGTTIDAGAGGDFVRTTGDHFTVFGGTGGDAIYVDGYRNNVYAGADGDTIDSRGTNNSIYGDAGGDTITMYDEQSWAFGGADGDSMTDKGVNNAMYGEAGDDVLNITEDAVNGSAFGGADNDIINMNGDHYADGGSGDDVINSVNGSGSIITGGSGRDTLNLDIPYTTDLRIDPAPNTSGNSFIISNAAGDVYSITGIERINFSNGAFGVPNKNGGWDVYQITKDDGPVGIATEDF